jgi:DTW domain-containing protein YfiP
MSSLSLSCGEPNIDVCSSLTTTSSSTSFNRTSDAPLSFVCEAIAVRSRVRCDRCARPSRVCICFVLPSAGPLPTPRLRVVVLQTRAESRAAIGTACLLPLVLADSVVHVVRGRQFPGHLLSGNEGSTSGIPVLLFPGAASVPLHKFTLPDAIVDDRNDRNAQSAKTKWEPTLACITLVVLDGSWEGAHKMLRKCSQLQNLQQVCLPHSLVEKSAPLFAARLPPSNIPGTLLACIISLDWYPGLVICPWIWRTDMCLQATTVYSSPLDSMACRCAIHSRSCCIGVGRSSSARGYCKLSVTSNHAVAVAVDSGAK